MNLKIVIIGSGNLATQLSRVLLEAGHQILQVFSRNIENAKKLAVQLNSKAISNLNQLIQNADLYIIAVTDDAIQFIIDHADLNNKNIIHTSGSVPISIFKGLSGNYGVFYPFQTFSKEKKVDFNNIPICIEANNEQFKLFLINLASQLSSKILEIDSETRQIVHLSGIFANNFVNHLYSLAGEILKEKSLPFDILQELISETVTKAMQIGPTKAQTGPARRNNLEILKKHLVLLSSKPDFQRIYKLISEDIVLKYK